MNRTENKRNERRLCYHWPVWFAKELDETLSQGEMVDISSWGGAFTCPAKESRFQPGEKITTRFSVPRFSSSGSFDMANFARSGDVCRIDKVNHSTRRIAVQFDKPLTFKPGEQIRTRLNMQECVSVRI